jgi:1-acyl-sn-glycerol-3-phosphate acyltransferase
MNNIQAVYSGNEYHTIHRKISWLARLFPSLSFYIEAVAIVWRGSAAARRDHYGATDWYKSSVSIVKALEKTGCHFHVNGLDNLLGIDRPCIFIGNHMSTLETFVLPSLIMPRIFDLTYIIKRSLVDYPVFGDIVRTRDPVVVERVNPREDFMVVMEEGARRLEQGRSLIIFPQHTRTIEFDPKQFNSIGIKLAKKTGAIIIPVALLTWAWSPGRMIKDFGPIVPSRAIHFAFGKPMEVSGKGQEEQQRIINFIQNHLAIWHAEH